MHRYTGADKRAARKSLGWQIARKRGSVKTLPEGDKKRENEREKSARQQSTRMENPFRVLKNQFGYVKVRFKGLAKNTGQILTLSALSNLWMARKRLLAMT